MKISVVIPVYNEVESVGALIKEVEAALQGRMDYEVLCVDDGSTDGTGVLLKEIEKDCHGLRILTHGRRCGKSTAMCTGIAAADSCWVVTLDGDGQNDPADILPLLAELEAASAASAVHLVNGARRCRRDGWPKRIFSRVANRFLSLVLRQEMIDAGCGLKLIRRDAFLALPRFESMHRYLPALIRSGGGEVMWVDVGHRPREKGRSKYGIVDRLCEGIPDTLGVLWLRWRMRVSTVEKDESSL